MAALEKFLKQIILKQVKGSVYLIPAICDTQIDDAIYNEEKQLMAFCKYLKMPAVDNMRNDEIRVKNFLNTKK